MWGAWSSSESAAASEEGSLGKPSPGSHISHSKKYGTAAPGSQASVSDPAASMPASALVVAVAPATASSVLPVGRAAVWVPSDPAAVVALASAPATSSHPVLELGVGHKDQHADFAMQRHASLWHDWHLVPTSELYVMTMDLEHVAADDVATTVRRRYGLPPRRQVGLRRRVSAFVAKRKKRYWRCCHIATWAATQP